MMHNTKLTRDRRVHCMCLVSSGHGLDEGVVAAIAVVGFGDGVEVEEFEHEVAVEGEQGVLNVFVE